MSGPCLLGNSEGHHPPLAVTVAAANAKPLRGSPITTLNAMGSGRVARSAFHQFGHFWRVLLSSAVYGLLFNSIGWRGCLWIGVLPALAVVYVRYFVKEPPVWVENRRIQRTQNREVRMPLLSIFKRGMISNTALACWWMAGGLVTYYSINGMFATHLQKDLGLSPALIATPIVFANAVVFLASMFWGWAGDRIGRRWAMIIPGLLGIPVAFFYMLSANYWVIVIGYVVQGALLGGGAGAHVPSYMNERFPTEVRATAAAFCYHLGTIFGGLVPPIVTYFALNYDLGFSIPMLIGCLIGGGSWCLALFKGRRSRRTDRSPVVGGRGFTRPGAATPREATLEAGRGDCYAAARR